MSYLWQHRTIPALRLKHRSGSCGTASALPKCSIMSGVAKMLDNVGLRYPHRASGAKAPRTLRPRPLLRFAVSATGGAHLCSIQYYLRFWLSSCRTSLAVSALRIMRYCPMKNKKALAAGLCGANYPWCIQKTHICWFEREKPVCHSFVSALERCAFLPALPGLCCR